MRGRENIFADMCHLPHTKQLSIGMYTKSSSHFSLNLFLATTFLPLEFTRSPLCNPVGWMCCIINMDDEGSCSEIIKTHMGLMLVSEEK